MPLPMVPAPMTEILFIVVNLMKSKVGKRKSKVFYKHPKTNTMSQQLKDRTKAFGIRIIKMVKEIRSGKVEDILIRQIVRSATSVGANYRSALRGRSKADFISKITVAEE